MLNKVEVELCLMPVTCIGSHSDWLIALVVSVVKATSLVLVVNRMT